MQPVLSSALRLLARRDHSVQELRKKLQARHFPSEIIDEVLVTLKNQGWQDDKKFGDAYVQSRVSRGDGPLKIRAALLERGLSKHLISEVLPMDGSFWHEQLLQLCHRKFPLQCDDLKLRVRQTRFLQSRGFTLEQISKLWNK